MLGSQALETAIGLVLMLLVIATAASATVEAISRALNKRATDLENAIGHLLAGTAAEGRERELPLTEQQALDRLKQTSVYKALRAGSKRKPSYMSARSFGHAVGEIVQDAARTAGGFTNLPAGLKSRLEQAAREARIPQAGSVALVVRGDLEHWFDETMSRLAGAYKRWATTVVFVVALVIAGIANASVFHVAARLWKEPATREAVANAAQQGGAGVTGVASATDKLDELGLPVGWDAMNRRAFGKNGSPLAASGFVLGWLGTAALALLGGPFWFDLLGKLVPLRGTGAKPPPAADDPASATAQLAATTTARAPATTARAAAAAPAAPGLAAPAPSTEEVVKAAFGIV